MPGHVFIVQGEPEGVHCDFWLPAPAARRNGTPDAFAAQTSARLAKLGALPQETARDRPLVGVPAPAGGRGEPERAGETLAALLAALHEAASSAAFDLVLAAPDGPTFAAAQALRRRQPGPDPWAELAAGPRGQAEALAERAAAGDLALFLGAGVSASAGLPLWGELLDQLAGLAGMSAAEREALKGLSPLDRAAVIEKRFGEPARLQKAIQRIFTRDRHSLTHALLAALPVREAVTTNYDVLFERAWEAAGREFSVLPHALRPGADAWVLKLHGCVSHAEDIVLTREDQYGYRGDRAALEGVVQALLITRHMLFVGFSLTDDHFHKVADAVRRVVRRAAAQGGETKPFGTTLVLARNKMVEELWGGDLDWACPADPNGRGGGGGAPEAARALEVFLDYLLSRIPGPAYLLDERFASVLTAEERALRDGLLALAKDAPRNDGALSAWGRVQGVLRELGMGAQ